MQLLACKIWYQASDAGTKRTLREPYIRAGESTRPTRQIMESLGLAVTGTEDNARGPSCNDTLTPKLDEEVKESKEQEEGDSAVGGGGAPKAEVAPRPSIARGFSFPEVKRKLLSKRSRDVLKRV